MSKITSCLANCMVYCLFTTTIISSEIIIKFFSRHNNFPCFNFHLTILTAWDSTQLNINNVVAWMRKWSSSLHFKALIVYKTNLVAFKSKLHAVIHTHLTLISHGRLPWLMKREVGCQKNVMNHNDAEHSIIVV